MLRFLLVEDSLLDAELAHAHLIENDIQCELIRVETREQFITALEKDRFDLILADYTLPTFDGLTALAIARELYPDLPFIFVSAHLGEELVVEALKSGATDYVLKQRLLRLASSVKRALRETEERVNLKKSEQDLRKAHQELTFHTENSPLAVVEWDQDFRVVRWSGQAEVIFGWSAEEILGKHPEEWRFVFEEDRDSVTQVIKNLQFGDEQRNVSFNRNYTKDGDIIHCEWYNSALIDESGNLLSVVSRAHDITERIQSEEEIRHREQQFRTLAENSPDIIARVDRQLRHLYISPAIEQVTGLPCAAFIGKTLAELELDPNMHIPLQAEMQQVLSNAQKTTLQFSFATPTGKCYYHARLVPEFSPKGKVESVLCITSDITDYKKSEHALRLSEARFRHIFESELIGMGFWDGNDKIIEINQAYLEIVGYPREEILTGRVDWRDITPAEYLPMEAEKGREVREYGRCEPYEKEYIRPDGSRVPALLGAAAFEPPLEGGVFFALDLTKIKQLEKQLLQQTEELGRANRLKDEFLAVLSHELRSPLNAMLGWAQLLRSRKFDEPTVARALETIERNARLQGQLIEDLLDISRIIQGKLSLNVSSVNPVTPIRAAIETMRLAAEAKSIQVDTAIASDVGLVSGDPSRLQQIVWNLLSNAIKFTPPGGRVEISLTSVTSKELDVSSNSSLNTSYSHLRPASAYKSSQVLSQYAQICISDTGQGIGAEFLPHVFEYFRQADSSITRSQGGLGLGLAIVRHLVEMHGGMITAESLGEGLGATFTVLLPLLSVRLEVAESNDNSDDALSLHSLRVLVVDDEPDAREFLIFMLQQFGAEAIAVASASEVIDILPVFNPHVLISDIGMPYEDGYSLIRKLRALPDSQPQEIPAIALTAYARAEDKQQAIAAGFQMHLPKPVNPLELAKAVAALAGRIVSDPLLH